MGYGVKSAKDILTMERAQPLSEHRLAIDAVIAISYWALNPRSRSQWSIVIMKFGLDFQSHQLNY